MNHSSCDYLTYGELHNLKAESTHPQTYQIGSRSEMITRHKNWVNYPHMRSRSSHFLFSPGRDLRVELISARFLVMGEQPQEDDKRYRFLVVR